MIKNRVTVVTCISILVFGILLFFVGTDGFSAFTSEAARVNRLKEEKPKFPDVVFEDSKGRSYSFSEFQGKYVLLTFIYTGCATVCPAIQMNMADVHHSLPHERIGKDVVFLSVSFDPSKDDPAALETYKDHFHSDGETWRMARIQDSAQLNTLLDSFGVVVIPDGYGNYAHNAAFYLIDKEGYLIDVLDYKNTKGAADRIIQAVESGEEARK